MRIPLIILCLLFPALAFSDAVNYFYDESGRLTRAVKSTEGVVYQYDEVGNLLSVIRETTTASPPVLQAVNPDVLFIGSTNTVLITGLNLITTKEVKSTNTSLGIRLLTVTDKSIKAEIDVSSAAAPNTATLTVTTFYGAANIAVTLSLSKLAFSPGQITLTPGSSGSITASITPSIGKSVNIPINNSNPAKVSSPQTLVIPSGGITTFNVAAISAGFANIWSGSANALILIKKPFTPEPGEELTIESKPVSVYMEAVSDVSTAPASKPVSVYMEAY